MCLPPRLKNTLGGSSCRKHASRRAGGSVAGGASVVARVGDRDPTVAVAGDEVDASVSGRGGRLVSHGADAAESLSRKAVLELDPSAGWRGEDSRHADGVEGLEAVIQD